MQVILGSGPVGYDDLGKGQKVVIMLHGWGANRKSLTPLATQIAKKFRVLLVDVPGFGESAKPPTTWGLEEYASFVSEFVKKLKISQVYAVVGHSNGGAIAVKLVAGGFDTEKLILLGASGVRKREKGKKLLYKVIAKTGKKATIVLPKRVRTKIRNKWYDRIGSELYHVPGMEAIFKKITKEDLVIDSAMINAKTLLIYGAEDQATPPVFGKIFHETIEGSELDIVEGAGHYSFVDKPTVVTKRVLDFLG